MSLQVARTSTGLVNRARRSSTGGGGDADQAAAAAAAVAGQAAEQQDDQVMETAAPEQAAAEQLLPASAELLCVTVDGQGRSTDDFMSLRLVHKPSMAQASSTCPSDSDLPAGIDSSDAGVPSHACNLLLS